MKKKNNMEIECEEIKNDGICCPWCSESINSYDLAAGACNKCRLSLAANIYKSGRIYFVPDALANFTNNIEEAVEREKVEYEKHKNIP